MRDGTGCSLNIVFFLKMFFVTLQVLLLQRLCLTCHCVHTLTPRGNRERPESGIYFKFFEKNTIFNEHPVESMFGRVETCVALTFIRHP